MFSRIHIDNFRCLENFTTIPGPQRNVLCGSGKSSVIDSVSAVIDLVCHGKQVQSVLPSQTVADPSRAQHFELDCILAGGLFSYSLTVQDERVSSQTLTVNSEEIFASEGKDVRWAGKEMIGDTRGSFLSVLDPSDKTPLGTWKQFLRSVQVLRFEGPISRKAFRGETVLSRSGSNFNAWYIHSFAEGPLGWFKLNEELRSKIPGFSGFRRKDGELLAMVGLRDIPFCELSSTEQKTIMYGALATGSFSCLLIDDLVDPSLRPGIQVFSTSLEGQGRVSLRTQGEP